MLKLLQSKELFMYSFGLLTLKCLLLPINIADSIVMLALSGLYGYNLFLKSKQERPINEEVKREIAEIKSVVTALSIKPSSSKSQPMGRMF